MFSFLAKCILLGFSQLSSLFYTKPNCIGKPLEPEKFSNEGDIGFLRDVCVDTVARNIYTTLGFPVSQSCEELANIRASTCFLKCFKRKPSSKRIEKVKNKIIAKAEVLMAELLDVLSHSEPRNEDKSAREFVYGRITEAKRRLIDSGAVAEDSQIADSLEDMKVFVCKHCAVIDNMDMADAVKQFTNNFNVEYETSVFNIEITDSVASATITGLFRLRFDFKIQEHLQTGSVIVKIPSLAPFYNTRWRRSAIYLREPDFYGSILPTLYQMGQIEPFAPKLYAIAKRCAFVLEDLSRQGYKILPRLESLDFNHSQLFLRVLARFHALGDVYFQNLKDDNPIKRLIGPHQPAIRRAIRKEEFDKLCKMVKPLLNENLYQKVLMAEDEILAPLHVQNVSDKNSINVISHGDLKRNNFSFKYASNGKVSHVKLINWQNGTLGNPALDLIEFFVHNLHEEIFETNEDELLAQYLFQFNYYIYSFGQSYGIYNRFLLERDMTYFRYYYFRVLSSIVIYWNVSHSSEAYELISKNIAKWIMYFEKKGYI